MDSVGVIAATVFVVLLAVVAMYKLTEKPNQSNNRVSQTGLEIVGVQK